MQNQGAETRPLSERASDIVLTPVALALYRAAAISYGVDSIIPDLCRELNLTEREALAVYVKIILQ